MLTGCVAIPTC